MAGPDHGGPPRRAGPAWRTCKGWSARALRRHLVGLCGRGGQPRMHCCLDRRRIRGRGVCFVHEWTPWGVGSNTRGRRTSRCQDHPVNGLFRVRGGPWSLGRRVRLARSQAGANAAALRRDVPGAPERPHPRAHPSGIRSTSPGRVNWQRRGPAKPSCPFERAAARPGAAAIRAGAGSASRSRACSPR